MDTPQHVSVREKRKRSFQGVVVSAAAEKTVTVRVDRIFRHPRFQRVVRRWRKFPAHDESRAAHRGDTVIIEETRPLSKRKRWKVVEVVSRAQDEAQEAE